MVRAQSTGGELRLVLLATLMVFSLLGCGGVSPRGGGGPEGPTSDRQQVNAEKAHIESLRHDAKAPQHDGQHMSCDQVCDVAEKVCSSRSTICQIADQHAGELSYANDCRWAEEMCGDSQAQCQQCGGSTGSQPCQ